MRRVFCRLFREHAFFLKLDATKKGGTLLPPFFV
jgi:hypothetical protein